MTKEAEEYYKNPVACLECPEPVPYARYLKGGKFCSRLCCNIRQQQNNAARVSQKSQQKHLTLLVESVNILHKQ